MTDSTPIDSSEYQLPKKRPVFLTVLCILTWIGSGVTFLQALIASLSGDPTDEFREIEKMPGGMELLKGMPSLEEITFWSNLSNFTTFLVSALCTFGAILMFKLSKKGFFLYLAGCIISIIVTAMAMNVLMPPMLAWVGMITVVLGALISAAFIIMYAVNLKHMN